MDFGINKPFKDNIRRLFTHHLAQEMQADIEKLEFDDQAQVDLKLSKITREKMAIWISEAWRKCSAIDVTKSIRSMGYIDSNHFDLTGI